MSQIMYFEYGEFLHPEEMQKIVPKSEPIERALLPFKQMLFKGKWSGKNYIVNAKKSCIVGALYQMDKTELRKIMKRYSNYFVPRVIVVNVRNSDGNEIRAVTFTCNNNIPTGVIMHLPPSGYATEMILKGYEYWDLSKEHFDTSVIKTAGRI